MRLPIQRREPRLFSIDAASPEEVDEMVRKAVNAGGTVYGEPGYKDGWMYGAGFADFGRPSMECVVYGYGQDAT
jgi:predicted lactoylglutathione lyase